MNKNLSKGVRRLASSLCAAVVAASGAVSAADLTSLKSDVADAPRMAHLEVAFAPSVRGMGAMFAVRMCARGEGQFSAPVIRETLVDGQEDIVVRLLDADGGEISRYASSTAVCDYAKFAAAVVARSMEATTRAKQK